ncbi:RCC1 domain-containing protein [Geodermatophilus sp. CPCC 205506]|uniref:RCC1 domain-containing protein n=1 Tax=Geodermatophilus sp. CPCC 205506 TaxID=2936596 RepID=UPI003F531B47
MRGLGIAALGIGLGTTGLGLPGNGRVTHAAEQGSGSPHYNSAAPFEYTLWTWGRNYHGQLGQGKRSESVLEPARVGQITQVRSVAGGEEHSVISLFDGTVWACGRNNYGQLGNCTYTTRSDFSQACFLSELLATEVYAGGDQSLAVFPGGRVFRWGSAYACRSSSAIPLPVDLPLERVTLAAGDHHQLALGHEDGRVFSWGANYYGQLGKTESSSCYPVPVWSPEPPTRAVAAGGDHSLALGDAGNVYSWGRNDYGQLGRETRDHSWDYYPQEIPGVENIVSVHAGRYHSLAIRDDRALFAWGNNMAGQLGVGRAGGIEMHPQRVLDDVTHVAAGAFHTLAVKSGSVWSWGNNTYGQLGHGDKNGRSSPARVGEFRDSIALAAGHNHSIVVRLLGV